VYGIFDLARILDSVVFYHPGPQSSPRLALLKSGTAAFDDYLGARWSMYQQVYFHKTATACEAMLNFIKRKTPSLTFPCDPDQYIRWDDTNMLPFLQKNISLLTTQDRNYLNQTSEDLFLNRCLWKKWHEEYQTKTHPFVRKSTDGMKAFLNKLVPNEIVESKTSLTRFNPAGRTSDSTNVLKVVTETDLGLPTLEPI
jgi:HD superfamily phosphohydrolase